MHVESIRLINFRNYKKLNIKLNKNLNIFLGHNAQGKTNLLESIYIASSGRSYRTNRDRELINIEKDAGYIGLKVVKSEFDKYIEIKFEKSKNKRVRINKVEIDKLSELIGQINVVIFSPEDLNLIKGGPLERRSFLDIEISQIKPRYRYNLSKYNKILFQRNNLLKKVKYDNTNLKTIDIWNQQLIDTGTEIIIDRINFTKGLSDISKDIHKKLTTENENLSIHYVSSFKVDEENIKREEIKENFKKLLDKSLDRDIERCTTEYGPHRDDIEILINGMTCRTYGSQGQQRTAALSLKLAEVELIKSEIGEYPILLLDDVLSELDINRRKSLVTTFKDIQTIITSTDDIEVDDIGEESKSVFLINNGEVLYKKG
ncbi:DNA replication and repair protein RecF [Gottschalkia acidurici 9a]|uniref:DNA replication and repair protein RecF n=1 Tax=Gottschalkia acidurici (strain ATCC 7906 / DSM 604 / BCRC 14475 / CIP 104303 / KCTC 5404 / NCIMB 10678 / 9a) TaxID=1128398 RepID=K0AV03_GOTA9|nr:DNA replication/repair protein RecF [Gottschalkia acidurici]AFS77089.1 DNA replication and repair protein RecF [Gottschalkia acidurici 9a]